MKILAAPHCGQCMSECISHWPVPNDLLVCSGSEMHRGVCPTGFFCTGGHCECGVYPDNIVHCNGTQSFILNSYCATTGDDEEENLISVGLCPHLPKHLPVDYNNAHMGRFYYPCTGERHPQTQQCTVPAVKRNWSTVWEVSTQPLSLL